jgi:V-type H+-transporting ATPase subunit a
MGLACMLNDQAVISNLMQVNQNTEALKKNFLELTELKHILRKTQQFFDEQDQLDVQGHYAQNQQLIPEESVYSASR